MRDERTSGFGVTHWLLTVTKIKLYNHFLTHVQCFDVRPAPAVFEVFALIGAARFIRSAGRHRCARVAHALFIIFVIAANAFSVSFRNATRATFGQ